MNRIQLQSHTRMHSKGGGLLGRRGVSLAGGGLLGRGVSLAGGLLEVDHPAPTADRITDTSKT